MYNTRKESIIIWNENQLMSLFYSYIAGSLHVSGSQAHLQESSYSCSHNHWFSLCAALFACTRTARHRYWTNGCVNSCTNSPEDGPVGPKHVKIQQYTNKIVTSVGFHSICWKDARYKKLKKRLCHVLRICPQVSSRLPLISGGFFKCLNSLHLWFMSDRNNRSFTCRSAFLRASWV